MDFDDLHYLHKSSFLSAFTDSLQSLQYSSCTYLKKGACLFTSLLQTSFNISHQKLHFHLKAAQ